MLIKKNYSEKCWKCYHYIFVFYIGFTFAACDVSNTKTENGNNGGIGSEVIPLGIGAYWDYSYEVGTSLSGNFRMTATGKQTVSGVSTTKIDYKGGIFDGYWILLANQKDELHFFGDEINGILSQPDMWVKSSCKSGDKWQTSGQGGTVNWTVKSVSATVTVPAGTFTCIHTQGVSADGGGTADHWWAVGVGEVKMIADIGGQTVITELLGHSTDPSNGDNGNGGNGDNGNGGNGGNGSACEVVLFDDFSGNLTDNWIPGRSVNVDDGIHDLSIENGELKWVQTWDYIESKASFGNDLVIEFDYRAGASSVQYGEFWVELVALTDTDHFTSGIYRGQYGNQNYHAVNIGRAPSPSDYNVVDKILDPPYLETMAPGSPREGKISFSYRDRQVQMQFDNHQGEILKTNMVSTGNFTESKIRIWGMPNRFIDQVTVCVGENGGGGNGGNGDNGNGNGNGKAEFNLVKIVDTPGTIFYHLDEFPTLNNSGTVAFWADENRNWGTDGIYTGDGGTLSTILHVNDANVQDIWGYKSINDNGEVAVQLQYLQNNTTIEVRKDNSRTEIFSKNSYDGVNEVSDVADPQLNNHGEVSFWKSTWTPSGTRYGIFTSSGTGLKTVVDDTHGNAFKRFSKITSINDDGEVFFEAAPMGGEFSIYKSNGNTRKLIAAPGGRFQSVHDGVINNHGHVAFTGTGIDGYMSWTGMFMGDGDSVTDLILARIDGSTPFMFVTHASFNDHGDIAFVGLHDGLTSGNGLYAGVSPTNHKVIEAGDIIDGKEVSIVSMSRHSINNNGQIVFFVGFADGSQAIYRADPR